MTGQHDAPATQTDPAFRPDGTVNSGIGSGPHPALKHLPHSLGVAFGCAVFVGVLGRLFNGQWQSMPAFLSTFLLIAAGCIPFTEWKSESESSQNGAGLGVMLGAAVGLVYGLTVSRFFEGVFFIGCIGTGVGWLMARYGVTRVPLPYTRDATMRTAAAISAALLILHVTGILSPGTDRILTTTVRNTTAEVSTRAPEAASSQTEQQAVRLNDPQAESPAGITIDSGTTDPSNWLALEPLKEAANGIEMKLVMIPKGTFLMGSNAGGEIGSMARTILVYGAGVYKGERPMHKVVITRPFMLGQTEVTRDQWQAVMGSLPTVAVPGTEAIPGDLPITNITWLEANVFCEVLTTREREQGRLSKGQRYRLPTEAEWEYACRGGTDTSFSFGDSKQQLGDYAWFAGGVKPGQYIQVNAVARKMPNPFGLFDMHGNAYEWCRDWYLEEWYEKSPEADPAGPSFNTGSRVVRGGGRSWIDCRSAGRSSNPGSESTPDIGFRVVCELSPHLALETSPYARELQHLSILMDEARAAHKRGDIDSAIHYCTQVLKLRATDSDALHIRALSRNAKGKETGERRWYAEACEDLTVAIDTFAGEGKELGMLYFNRGCILTDDLGQHRKALQDFRQAQALGGVPATAIAAAIYRASDSLSGAASE